ncbi:beta-galactosidase (plasmid) [Pedobacter sp. BS3]|uniref:glycoside hydrolase family 2 TIM barrel-domain containing protein n=1 Tax=Pedobacter sp. BS3 TaxID=2567937 RepID=UPI0011EC8B8E|nr:glycoside hydrolase family 2 TIM barrel-domain containing protein [Pedobacter sp. BS3]TZF85842.1 beta-galactosidase [Pedobacter sp. BS3]
MRFLKISFFILSISLSLYADARNSIVNAEAFKANIPRLSPLPQEVAGTKNAQLTLNGKWQFTVGAGNKTAAIEVPGEWEMQGFTVHEGETALYSRPLNIPAEWNGKRIKIRFDGVSSHAVVKVNGKQVASHEGGFVPFEVDITSALKSSDNILQVEVQALTISDRLACVSQYAAHTVGGILRKVTLFALPGINIADMAVTTTFDSRFKNASLNIQYSAANEANRSGNATLKFRLSDKEGKIVTESASDISVNANATSSKSVTLKVNSPKKWDAEHPYLYTLTTELYENGKLLQRNTQRVGFRQIDIKNGQLLVNGMPVKLRGVNRHDIYPLTGRSITPDLCRKDAELFRAGNCNYIRTSHYPPSTEFLEAADELGLFVESEAALCWVGHGAAPVWRKWDYSDTRFLPFMVAANVEKMIAQRNHPSIIIWSLGNESRWSPLWSKVNEIVKQLDPSRPTSFHDQAWGKGNHYGSQADIAVYHYPNLRFEAFLDTIKRPVLFGEYAHVSCYNRRELVTDPGIRDGYGAPLAQMYTAMYKYKSCLGGAIWSGIDDTFHLPDGRIIGYGPWGVIDGWRRLKPEYFGMKKAYSPVVITNISHPVVEKNNLKLSVENRYDFTNLKELKISCTVDGKSQTIHADIPPHGQGVVNIPVNGTSKEVLISFTDPRGFIANEEKIILKESPVNENYDKVNVSYAENDASITVQQGKITYLISKTTGMILSVKKESKEIVRQGPVFGIVPLNKDDGGKPGVANQTYQNDIYPFKNYPLSVRFTDSLSVQKQADGIKISMNVTYTNAEGKQSYHFLNNGTVTAGYQVQYKGVDSLPRQYGMMMQLPVNFDRLSWKRKGDFSMYPDNNIGRNEGEAYLNAVHLRSVEKPREMPAGDWRDDANDLGSNDFRSTKRYIYRASLTDKSGNGIEIISDGTQAVRAWLQDERMQLLVADYNNNGSEPFYRPPASDGKINIARKTVSGQVTFRIK